MENKKNYIDGVDVSGCNNIDEWEHCNICQVLIKTVPNRHQCLTEGDLRCEFYPDCYYKQLQRTKVELKKYEDMAKKGLEEFKDVGGCWGCGLQLQLNQDMEDIKQLKAENEQIKKDYAKLHIDFAKCNEENERLKEENKKLKYYLNKIREDELNSMDVEWDEYITECTSTEYTNIITFVELALGERDE